MRFIVALTGASGQIYARRLLTRLLDAGAEIFLTLSEPACVTLAEEEGVKLNAHSPDLTKLLGDVGDGVLARVQYFGPRQIAAPVASGSVRHDGMIVVPCSMGTLGRITHGVSDDLIARAADVALKERRKLILVTREMPLSLIHLRNMTAATEAGALILHACPHFYHRPQTVEDVADTVVERILDQLDVPSDIRRWKSDGQNTA
jgi:4-hydroxy-3-polyprenylbenzoate decarboxylase